MKDRDTKDVIKWGAIGALLLYIWYRIKNPGGGGTNLLSIGDTIGGRVNILSAINSVVNGTQDFMFSVRPIQNDDPYLQFANVPRKVIAVFTYNDGSREYEHSTQTIAGSLRPISEVLKIQGTTYFAEPSSMVVSTDPDDPESRSQIFFEYKPGVDQIV